MITVRLTRAIYTEGRNVGTLLFRFRNGAESSKRGRKMKKRFFFRGAALASALVLLTPLAAASANDSSFRGSESADVLIDPEYDYSVVGVEPAAHVRDRAQNLLGERYVDLWITPDQTSYVVGVHDVLPKEVARLESAIAEVAPVMVVNRPISRDRKSTRLNSSHVAISYAV